MRLRGRLSAVSRGIMNLSDKGYMRSELPLRIWNPPAAAGMCVIVVALAAAYAIPLRARQRAAEHDRVVIRVKDETGTAVPDAELTLTPATGGPAIRGETDDAGRASFPSLPPAIYRLSAEKTGFYPITGRTIDLRGERAVEITLPHQREYSERVEVHYTPPVIDPHRTAATQTLSSRDVVNIPYPTNRDYRNILPLIPGVTPAAYGQFHVNGSDSTQIYERLDGFDVSQPVSGLLNLRISPDALRSVEVVGSRLPAELGKGSGQALSLETGMGDDHFRFASTDFIPSFQNRKGIQIEAFTPRLTFSGPIRKGKAWFYDAGQGEYDLNIVTELPAGADQAPLWRWNNLAKAQVNPNASNQITASFLLNRLESPRNGLDALDPLETTTHLSESVDLGSIKDEMSLPGGSLLEWGFAFSQFGSNYHPRGSLPYVIRPEGTSGNYFETSRSTARRFEGIANLSLPAFDWHGQHQLRFGVDLDRVVYHQNLQRGTILIYREDGTLDRQASFSGPVAFDRNNVEASGYAEDGWAASNCLFLDAGLRLDWDGIIRRALVSPRLAISYMLASSGKTKLTGGVGLSYAATNLALFSLPLEGQRKDLFLGTDGQTPLGPAVVTSFNATPAALTEPRFLNWSAGLERMLPHHALLDLEYIGRRGSNGFDYQNVGTGPAPALPSGSFVLQNGRNDTYDAFRATIRVPFHDTDLAMVSYTRSRARTSAALAPTFESLLFSPQLPGPLPWDSPNRLLSWGWAPLIRKFQLDYVVDWRTGHPFNVVDENQRLVGLPGSHRFPDFFSLDLFLERRFRLFGYEWALRGGFNNITGRRNPAVVVNNIDSPQFLTFEQAEGRAFTGRIRFLGRK
jgi:Carboxypeptidase regulatory-like domain